MHLRSRKDKTRTKNFFSFRPLIWNFQHGFFFMRDVIMWYKLDLPRHVSIISCSSCVQLLIDETKRSVVNLMGINNRTAVSFSPRNILRWRREVRKVSAKKNGKNRCHMLQVWIFLSNGRNPPDRHKRKRKKETCQTKISIINSLVFIYYTFKRVRGSARRLFLYT